MKLETDGATLRISAIKELSASSSHSFREEVRRAFGDSHANIEVDLSQTAVVDSSGLGALAALHKTASSHGGTLRLRNPNPAVQQMLELTRMHQIFEVVRG